jgi:adenylate cyclase
VNVGIDASELSGATGGADAFRPGRDPRGRPMLADRPDRSRVRLVCATMPAVDYESAGLLEGLEGDDRGARERLLDRLVDEGFTLEELDAAVREDRLPLLLVERVLGGRYSAKQLEERTGLEAAQMLRIRRLLGLPEASPDDLVFGEEEVAAAQSTRLFLDVGLGEDSIAEITRVLGEGMSRLAATTAAAFVDAFLEPGDSEDDVAQRFASVAEELIPAIDPVLIAAYKQHLAEAVRRGILSRAERETGEAGRAQEITVCFVDMVGFTRLGAQIEAEELGSLASKLAELANHVTEPPVRLVKTIGDAAMFVSPEPGPLVSVALSLMEAVEAADLPSLRAGVAFGPALQRAGDFYGHAVNLASRVTGEARPGSVLCTEEVRDAAPDRFDWSFARKHKLKGMSDAVPLYRPRRLADDDPPKKTESKAGRRRTRAAS